MGEEMIIKAAETAATEAVSEAAVKAAAESAVGEAVKLTWKEGVMLGLSGIGAAALVAGGIFGAVKLTKHISKKIKAKKGVPVADEIVDEAEEAVQVEGSEPEN